MKRLLVGLVLFLLLGNQLVAAMERGSLSIGPKIWFADPKKVRFLTFDEQVSESQLIGLQVSYDLSDSWWISGLWMEGSFDSSWIDYGERFGDFGAYLMAEITMEETDAEIILARTFRYADVGVGLRYSKYLRGFEVAGVYVREQYGVDSVAGEQENDALGPMVYLGLGGSFWSSPVSWYTTVSVMPLDFDDSGAEHFAGEAGLALQVKNLVLTVGARHKEYFDPLEVPVVLQGGGAGGDEVSEWDMAFTGLAIGGIIVF